MTEHPETLIIHDSENDMFRAEIATGGDVQGNPAIYTRTNEIGAYITADQIPALVARLSAYYCYLTGEDGIPTPLDTDRDIRVSHDHRLTELEERVSDETEQRAELERRAKISVTDLRERITELEVFRYRLNAAFDTRD